MRLKKKHTAVAPHCRKRSNRGNAQPPAPAAGYRLRDLPMEIVERISDGRRSPALTWIRRRDEGFSLARRRHRDRSTTHIEQLVPPLGLGIGPVLDLPPLNAAPVGIALALGNDTLEVVLFHRCHERLAATIDRHGFGDQVIGAPVRRRLSRFFRSTSGNGRRSLPLSQSRSKATKHGSLRRRRST